MFFVMIFFKLIPLILCVRNVLCSDYDISEKSEELFSKISPEENKALVQHISRRINDEMKQNGMRPGAVSDKKNKEHSDVFKKVLQEEAFKLLNGRRKEDDKNPDKKQTEFQDLTLRSNFFRDLTEEVQSESRALRTKIDLTNKRLKRSALSSSESDLVIPVEYINKRQRNNRRKKEENKSFGEISKRLVSFEEKDSQILKENKTYNKGIHEVSSSEMGINIPETNKNVTENIVISEDSKSASSSAEINNNSKKEKNTTETEEISIATVQPIIKTYSKIVTPYFQITKPQSNVTEEIADKTSKITTQSTTKKVNTSAFQEIVNVSLVENEPLHQNKGESSILAGASVITESSIIDISVHSASEQKKIESKVTPEIKHTDVPFIAITDTHVPQHDYTHKVVKKILENSSNESKAHEEENLNEHVLRMGNGKNSTDNHNVVTPYEVFEVESQHQSYDQIQSKKDQNNPNVFPIHFYEPKIINLNSEASFHQQQQSIKTLNGDQNNPNDLPIHFYEPGHNNLKPEDLLSLQKGSIRIQSYDKDESSTAKEESAKYKEESNEEESTKDKEELTKGKDNSDRFEVDYMAYDDPDDGNYLRGGYDHIVKAKQKRKMQDKSIAYLVNNGLLNIIPNYEYVDEDEDEYSIKKYKHSESNNEIDREEETKINRLQMRNPSHLEELKLKERLQKLRLYLTEQRFLNIIPNFKNQDEETEENYDYKKTTKKPLMRAKHKRHQSHHNIPYNEVNMMKYRLQIWPHLSEHLPSYRSLFNKTIETNNSDEKILVDSIERFPPHSSEEDSKKLLRALEEDGDINEAVELINAQSYHEQKYDIGVDHLETVMGDMVKMDNTALEQFDWLGTAVDIQAGLEKLIALAEIDGKDSGHPEDSQILKYTRPLYIQARSNIESDGGVNIEDISDEDCIEKVDNEISELLKSLRSLRPRNLKRPLGLKLKNPVPVWSLVHKLYLRLLKEAIINAEEKKMHKHDFKRFLEDIRSNLDDLHNAIKYIAMISTYESDSWWPNLKAIYFNPVTKKNILELALHILTTRLLELIENSAHNGLEDDFVHFVKNNEEEFLRTKTELVQVLKILQKLRDIE